ncbi:MAG: FG-GAP repeat protein [Planctomycetes bacterium]|nr:FG-GAP repeat protein [Planctomycetota bacterium]
MKRVWNSAAWGLVLASAARAQAPLYDLFSLTPGEQFGSSVVGLGDVDGDGIGDLAVGCKGAAGAQAGSGAVRIYSGVSGALIRQINGERSGDQFGHAIDWIGDIDGDGVNDLIIGAPNHEWTSGTDRGAVYTYSGATGAQIWKLGGNADGDRLGFAVSRVPDVNADGIDDYAFSKPWGDSGSLTDNGVVWIHSGATHASLRLYTGAASGDHFGYALDGIADVNGDGRGDLLIGAPQADAAGIFDSGRAYRVSGASSGTTLTTYSGSTSAGWFGHTVAGLPDTSGDGRPETLVGEPFVSVGGVTGSGRIRAYSSSNGAVLLTLSGATQDAYGWVMCGMGDFDGDGKGDVQVGVPFADYATWTNTGLAKVYSGASGALLTAMTGYYDGEGFGAAVGDAGDINGDGFHDAIAGSPKYNQYGVDAGRARVVLGNAEFPTNYCTGKTNSQGCEPLIGIGGCASATVGDLQIVGVNVLPNVSGIMIWSLSSAATPFYGGTLCLGAPIRRTPVQNSTVNVSVYPCTGIYNYHFSRAKMAAEGLVPGMRIKAQYWSRDNGFVAPNNIGLTNAVDILILP